MSLFSRLLDAVRSWRQRGTGPKAARRAGVSVEHLDHRQLLSVNFTGNVATDFPASMSPGVVVIPENSSVQHPVITNPALANIVKVSGFDLSGLRVSYTASDDTLSVGIEQPPSQQATQPGPVIAGDSDNNGDDGTVSPAVTAIAGTGFKDFADFGGSEFMSAFLDLKGQGFADIAAGYAINDPRQPKQYQVAEAVVNPTPPPVPLDFGTGQVQQPGTTYETVPAAAGNVYKVNSPAHPNLEFAISHFSELYLQDTGTPLTPSSVIGIGATAGSGDTPGISKAFFPEQKFTLAAATVPPTPPPSPPVIINPHENKHINTAHPTLIRVNVIGSSGFNVTQIIPSTVTLGGAHPIFSFDRFINNDEWPDATFVFRGTDVNLPAGFTEATITGNLTNGQTFSSSVQVFNRNASYYTTPELQGAADRQAARAARSDGFVVLPATSPVAVTNGTFARLAKRAYPPGSPNGNLVNSTLTVDQPTVSSAAKVGALSASVPLKVSAPVKAATPAPKAVKAGATTASAHVKAPATPRETVKLKAPTARPQAKAQAKTAGQVVSIEGHKSNVPRNLQLSLRRFVRNVGAYNLNTNAVVGNGFSNRFVRSVGAVNLNTNTAIGPGSS
jgi:hypothetical protein